MPGSGARRRRTAKDRRRSREKGGGYFTHSGARQLLSLIGGLLLLLGQLDLHLTKSAGMDSCIIAVLVICSLTAPAFGDKGTSKARSCSDIKLFYSGKGFAMESVPQSEISGKPP